jgi:NDP-sugar pyrophosphorylase family protein
MIVRYVERGQATLQPSPPTALGSLHGIVLAGAYPHAQSGLDSLRPRPLLPVAERPLIAYALRWMHDGGLSTATVCTNVATRTIHPTLGGGGGLSMDVDYLEDWQPRGPAGCVRDAGVRTDADTFVVADGTTVPVTDLGALLEAHQSSGAAITVVVHGPSASGNGGANRALQPNGLYVFARRVLEHLPKGGFQDIKETLIPRLYCHGEHVRTYQVPEMCPRVVNTESYLALNQWVLERLPRLGGLPPGFRVSDDVAIHDSASVAPSARLIGPVLLGRNTSVQARATVVGPASIGPGSIVGKDAVVSRSVLWGGCVVHSGAFVDRCVVAESALVRSGEALSATLRTRASRHEAHGAPRTEGWRLRWPLGRAALRPPVTDHL